MKNININPSELKKALKKQRFIMNVKINVEKGMTNKSIKLLNNKKVRNLKFLT